MLECRHSRSLAFINDSECWGAGAPRIFLFPTINARVLVCRDASTSAFLKVRNAEVPALQHSSIPQAVNGSECCSVSFKHSSTVEEGAKEEHGRRNEKGMEEGGSGRKGGKELERLE